MRVRFKNNGAGLRLSLMAAVVVGGIAAVPVVVPAQAQQAVQGESGDTVVIDKFVLDQLYSRLERLERDMRGLVRTGNVPAGGGNYPDVSQNAAVAELNIKISNLETELASVTGELEEARHKVDRLQDRVALMQKDTEYRIGALEKNKGPSANLAADLEGEPGADETDSAVRSDDPTSAAGDGTDVLPGGAPAERYNFAIGLLRQGAYAEAEQAFQAFLDEHPEDDLASNASYWLGETYYVRDQHKEAASAFLGGLKAYPQGNKASQSMLKLGMALLQLGHMEQACATLSGLEARFPDAPAKVKERAVSESKKAGCAR